MKSNDTDLVRRLNLGQRDAQRELWDQYYSNIYRHVLAKVARDNNEHDAEEITQETFLRAFLSVDKFEGRSKLRTWLLSLAHNAGVDHYRSPRNRYEACPPEQSFSCCEAQATYVANPGNPPGALHAFLGHERRDRILASIAKLNEEQRSVVIHRLFDGLSVTETAELMGITEGAVKMRFLRAIQNLEVLLKGDPYFDDEGNKKEKRASHESN